VSDQLVKRPLPKHRTTQIQNKHIHTPNINALCEISSHDLASERGKTAHALDRSATVTCIIIIIIIIIIIVTPIVVVAFPFNHEVSYRYVTVTENSGKRCRIKVATL
jgi:hypothetical protein